MDRRILIQVTAPMVLIGLILFATCLASAWIVAQIEKGDARYCNEFQRLAREAIFPRLSHRDLADENPIHLVVDPCDGLLKLNRDMIQATREDSERFSGLAHVDRGQFRSVLVNLLLDALNAMPSGGCLEVHLMRSRKELLLIEVTNTGNGISTDMEGLLFTPFASTKPTGMGLGLCVCRRVVEEHGGTIRGENRARGGASFSILLPEAAREQ